MSAASLEETTHKVATQFDVRVAIVGNVDSGKSTLIGVLTNGGLDDGRGLARSKVFQHRHEAANGRTSCIGQHILGFDEEDEVVHQTVSSFASAQAKNKGWREVVMRSRSTLTLIDLAGHERYLKTTIAGLTGSFPDYAIVVIGANAGVMKMTREHLGVVIALKIPFICVVTKVDMAPKNVLARTKKQLFRILKSSAAGGKKPFHIKSEADVKMCSENVSHKLCPVFFVSTVTGDNLPLLTTYLASLKPRLEFPSLRPPSSNGAAAAHAEPENGDAPAENGDADAASPSGGSGPVEFRIDETFVVTGVGLIISGTVTRGVLHENTSLRVGPFSDGSYRPVLARTLQYKRVPVTQCGPGSSCAVSVRSQNRKLPLRRSEIRRGMVMVDVHTPTPRPVHRFEAEILVLHHPTSIGEKYQAVIHCGIVRQTATLVELRSVSSSTVGLSDEPSAAADTEPDPAPGEASDDAPAEQVIRTGDRARVVFEFLSRPELVSPGQVLIFREGSTKGVGRVTKVIYEDGEEYGEEDDDHAEVAL